MSRNVNEPVQVSWGTWWRDNKPLILIAAMLALLALIVTVGLLFGGPTPKPDGGGKAKGPADPPPGEARDLADPTELVERAIKARAGDPARIDRMGSMTQSMTGTIFQSGANIPATREVKADWPDRFRFEIKMDVGAEKVNTAFGLNGGNGWYDVGGGVQDMDPARLEEFRDEVNAEYVATLVPLRKDGYELIPIAGRDVAGKPADGARVKREGRCDVDLFFDREEGRLVQVTFQTRESGVSVTKEWLYGDYREFDGLTLPGSMRVFYNGKRFASFRVTEHRFPREIAPSAFVKPKR